MFTAEDLKLLLTDQQGSGIPFALILDRIGRAGIVLVFDEENLEDFPAEGLQVLDDRCHVFLPVEVADDRVQFELDPQCSAPVADAKELFDVFACPAADEFVLMEVAQWMHSLGHGAVLRLLWKKVSKVFKM